MTPQEQIEYDKTAQEVQQLRLDNELAFEKRLRQLVAETAYTERQSKYHLFTLIIGSVLAGVGLAMALLAYYRVLFAS